MGSVLLAGLCLPACLFTWHCWAAASASPRWHRQAELRRGCGTSESSWGLISYLHGRQDFNSLFKEVVWLPSACVTATSVRNWCVCGGMFSALTGRAALWGPWLPFLWQRHLTSYPYRCTLADFQIEKKIGRGQFSEVYKATCLLDRKPVALKKVQVSVSGLPLGVGWEGSKACPWPGGWERCPAGPAPTSPPVDSCVQGRIAQQCCCFMLMLNFTFYLRRVFTKLLLNVWASEALVPWGAAIPMQLNYRNMERKKAGACWWSWRRLCENLDIRSVHFLNLAESIGQYSEQHFVWRNLLESFKSSKL